MSSKNTAVYMGESTCEKWQQNHQLQQDGWKTTCNALHECNCFNSKVFKWPAKGI